MKTGKTNTNLFGQPVGPSVPKWQAPPPPPRTPLNGVHCRLEPLNAGQHAASLFAANTPDPGSMWTYLGYGPFAGYGDYKEWMTSVEDGSDPAFFAIIDAASGQASGVAAYLRLDRSNGVIEVGHIAYAPQLRRTIAATEAMYLMMAQAFALGYRRYEWKCDALNAPSRAAAERLGFQYEGTFRQAVIYKGRSRDTAWFSITDREWPLLKRAYDQWLAPENFDDAGKQRQRLADLIAAIQ